MGNFQNTFETSKRSVISAFSICMTAPLIKKGSVDRPSCQAFLPNIIYANGRTKKALKSSSPIMK